MESWYVYEGMFIIPENAYDWDENYLLERRAQLLGIMDRENGPEEEIQEEIDCIEQELERRDEETK